MDYTNKSKEEIIKDLEEIQNLYVLLKESHKNDIAELGIAKNELEASEKKYRLLTENMSDIIWELSAEMKFTYISKGIEKLTGFKASEILGKNIFDLIDPLQVEDIKITFKKRLENFKLTGQLSDITYEFRQVRKDGKFIWVNVSSSPRFGINNELIGFQGITRDISESKKAVESLKSSEEKLSKVFNNAPYIITLLRISDRKLIDINQAVVELTGYSRDEMLNNASAISSVWGNPEQIEKFYQAAQNQEKLHQVEIEYRTRNGEIGYALMTTEFITIDNELCVLSFFEIITKRKHAEELLEENREKYRGLSEAAFDAIFIFEEGICLEQNQIAEQLFGYTSGEATGKNGIDWIAPEDREKVNAHMLSSYEEPFKALALRKDGTTFPALIRARMMHYKGRNVRVTSMSDISLQINAEERLIESEKQFRLIFENSNDAIFWAEVETGRLIKCNKAAETLIERTQGEIIGKHFSFLHLPEKVQKHQVEFNEHVKHKGNLHLETEVLTKSGQIKIVEVISTVINVNGIEINQGIFKDISDKKRLEVALRNVLINSGLKTEENIFSTLVLNLAIALNVKHAFVGQLFGNNKERIKTLSFCKDGKIAENFEYDIKGTPSAEVIERGFYSFEEEVGYLFPDDLIVKEMDVKGYMGMPLKSSKDEVLGVIVILNDSKFELANNTESVLSLFAYRAANELERKRDEDDLMDSWANLLAIVENTRDIIWAIDQNYHLIFINGQFEREFKAAFGIQLVPGMNILENLPEPMVPIWKSRYDRALAGERYIFEEHFVFGDTQIYSEVAMNPIFVNEKVIGVSVFSHDITERKQAEILVRQKNQEIENQNKELIQAEEKLKLSEETYRGMLDTISEAVYIQDLNGVFLEVNHSVEKLYGFDKAFFIGKTPEFLSASAKNDQLQLASIIERVLNGEPQTFEFWGKRKDNSVFPKEVNCTLGNYFGKKVIIAVARDISERKHADITLLEKNKEIASQNEEYLQLNEELLKANDQLIKAKEKAEESDRLKTSFLQNMSHEIRTPMNAIMGFSSLLANQYNNKPKLEQFSEIINSRCSDLLDIINDILDIAKIESGHLVTSYEVLDLNIMFFELLAFFKENQKRTGKDRIEFNMRPFPIIKENLIVSDAVKLKQIFINLLGNAFKFTESGKIEVNCSIKNNMLVFAISDTGIGIPPDKKEYIFERFAQVYQSKNKLYGGTGLGLSIVKGLVSILGGNIWLESEL